jgi:hypothetical protein
MVCDCRPIRQSFSTGISLTIFLVMPLKFEVESCYHRFDICILPQLGREASAGRFAEASQKTVVLQKTDVSYQRW